MKKKKFALVIACICITLVGCKSPEAANEEKKEEDTYTIESAQGNPVQLGKGGEVGDWEVCISSVQETQKVICPKHKLPEEDKKILKENYNIDYDKKDSPTYVTNEKFIIVDMVLKNIGSGPINYKGGDFIVKDTKTQRYSWDQSGLIFSLNGLDWYETKDNPISPGQSVKFIYACEVSAEAKLDDLLLESSNKTSEDRYTYFKLK